MPAVVQIIASFLAIGSTPTSVTVPGEVIRHFQPTFIGGSVSVGTDRLLQEDNTLLLQETDDQILLDAVVLVPGETFTLTITLFSGAVTTDVTDFIQQEDGFLLLQENDDRLQLEALPPTGNALTDVSGNFLTDVNGNYLLGVT